MVTAREWVFHPSEGVGVVAVITREAEHYALHAADASSEQIGVEDDLQAAADLARSWHAATSGWRYAAGPRSSSRPPAVQLVTDYHRDQERRRIAGHRWRSLRCEPGGAAWRTCARRSQREVGSTVGIGESPSWVRAAAAFTPQPNAGRGRATARRPAPCLVRPLNYPNRRRFGAPVRS